MSTRSKLAVLACAILFAYPQVAVADEQTIAKMALIVIELQHFPSDSAKASLAAIAEDPATSAAEKQIATAIANIQHKVTSADREHLAAIIADESAPDGARKLATVINGINHSPSEQDLLVLRKLASA